MNLFKKDREKKNQVKWVNGHRVYKRQLELLKKYFTVNDKDHTVLVDLYYDSAEDIIDPRKGNGTNDLVKDEVLSDIKNIMGMIPNAYKIRLQIVIDDYKGYSPEQLMISLKDNIDFHFYEGKKEIMRNRRMSILLLGFGIMILTFVGFVAMKHPFGTTEAESIVTEVMDDAASVFIWEAVTIAFLETSTIASQQMIAANRFASISLSSSNPKEKSITVDSHNIFTETGGDVADSIISKTEEGLEELVDKARKEKEERMDSLFHREKEKEADEIEKQEKK
jgi:hypothetical protein